jgi:hypothetical protein
MDLKNGLSLSFVDSRFKKNSQFICTLFLTRFLS